DPSEVAPIEIEAELVRERTGEQRLAGTRSALEQGCQATRRRDHLVEAPEIVHGPPVPDPGDELGDAVLDRGGQDELRPRGEAVDPGRNGADRRLEVLPQRGLDRRVDLGRRGSRDRRDDVADGTDTDGETHG